LKESLNSSVTHAEVISLGSARLTQIATIIREIAQLSNTATLAGDKSTSEHLASFSDSFERLFGLFPHEYEEYQLDEVIVAAILPIV
jgi:methylphosphotriester-DNA--protein-cysteine methyltransferase